MSEMNAERFAALLAAYGAAPDRWPEGERAPALARIRTDPAAAAAFERESAFDDLLGASITPAPSPALFDSVLAKAPVARLRKKLLTWWTGLALAGAGAAGVLCGSAAAAAFEPASALPSYSHNATAFGTIATDPEDS